MTIKKRINTLYSIFCMLSEDYESFMAECIDDIKEVLSLSPIKNNHNISNCKKYFSEMFLLIELIDKDKNLLSENKKLFFIDLKDITKQEYKLYKFNSAIAKKSLKHL